MYKIFDMTFCPAEFSVQVRQCSIHLLVKCDVSCEICWRLELEMLKRRRLQDEGLIYQARTASGHEIAGPETMTICTHKGQGANLRAFHIEKRF